MTQPSRIDGLPDLPKLPLQGLSSWLHHMAYKSPADSPTLIAWAKEADALVEAGSAAAAQAAKQVPDAQEVAEAFAAFQAIAAAPSATSLAEAAPADDPDAWKWEVPTAEDLAEFDKPPEKVSTSGYLQTVRNDPTKLDWNDAPQAPAPQSDRTCCCFYGTSGESRMSTEDQSRSEFEAWMKSEGRGDGFERLNQAHPLYGLEQGDYGSSWTQSDWEAWQASRRTYRASVLEEAAKYLDGLHAEQKGRCNYYAFAANGVRALAAKTQEGQ